MIARKVRRMTEHGNVEAWRLWISFVPMDPILHFAYCPRCGEAATAGASGVPAGPFRCVACGFTLFFNSAGAVAAIICRDDGRALFIRRAKDPGRGKLGMPGGYVDPGESGEQALSREEREEVGLDLLDIRYLSSHPNQYFYGGVTYQTLDLFYTGRVDRPDHADALDAVDSIAWIDPRTVPLDEIAFESMRQALVVYRSR
jgi:ADP-ribose pyrophosphatase YjhB (NUDIX family)